MKGWFQYGFHTPGRKAYIGAILNKCAWGFGLYEHYDFGKRRTWSIKDGGLYSFNLWIFSATFRT